MSDMQMLPNTSLLMRVTSVQHTDTGLATDLWLWRPVATPEPGSIGALADLHAQGWQTIDTQSATAMVIWGQFGRIRSVLLEGIDKPRRLARQEDIERIRYVPVALGFSLPEQARGMLHGDQVITAAIVLPPPQCGEFAMVADPEDIDKELEHVQWHIYHVSTLGEDGIALYARMGDALRALADPAEWWPLTPELLACLAPNGYHTETQALHSALLAATTQKERNRIRERQRELAMAYERAKTLHAVQERINRNPADYQARLSEVQQMAQQLAALYWEAHQTQQARAKGASVAVLDTPEAETSEDIGQAEPPRSRRSRTPRAALVVKDPPAVHVRSDIFTQGIMRGLIDGREYKQFEERSLAEYSNTLAKRKGDITITLTPGDGENWEHVLRSLNMLGDEVVDTFCAVFALAIDTNGVENVTAPMWVNTDDLLKICQRKQSNRAYTPEQRAACVEHLRILSRAHVRADWPTPGKRGRSSFIDSAILDVFGQAIGEYKTITGETVWERRQVKIGEWARLMGTFDKETAILLRAVLAYHSKNDRYAKRLGRYLSLQFRVNWRRHEGTVERTMGVLLEQAGIKPDMNNAGRARDMIESALARLRRDGVIADYGAVIEATAKGQAARERIEQRAYRWWDDYAAQLWYFKAPAYATAQYRTIPTLPSTSDDGK